jgi:hypothetical protein
MAEMSMEEFRDKLERWSTKFPEAAQKYLKRSAEVVREETVIKHLSGPRMPRGATSLKNATLGRVSGDLANSITTSVKRRGGGYIAEIGNLRMPLKYAYQWEKQRGRPFLLPSIEAKRGDIIKMLTKAIKESYNDA